MLFDRGGSSPDQKTVNKKILALDLVKDPDQFSRFELFSHIYRFSTNHSAMTEMANDPDVCRSLAFLMRTLPTEQLIVDKQFIIRDYNPEIKKKFPYIDSIYTVRRNESLPEDFPNDFGISNVDNIIKDIINIIRNPLLVAELLKPLNTRVSEELKKNGIEFSELDDPAYFIPGYGSILPGPPKGGFQRLKKLNNLLDRILLKDENKEQVNLPGSPLFYWFIPNEVANDLVKEGNIFREYPRYGQMILHGAYTHRLMLQILWAAMDKNLIDTSYIDKTTNQKLSLTKRQLLQLLVCFETRYNVDPSKPDDPMHSLDSNPWISLFEQLIDIELDQERAFDIGSEFQKNDVIMQRISPFVVRRAAILNSFITCFGKDLGVAELSRVLCNMTWKQYLKMVRAAYDTGCIQQRVSREDVYSQLVLMRICLLGSEQAHDLLPFAASEALGKMLSNKYVTFYSPHHQPKKTPHILLKKSNSVVAAEKSADLEELKAPISAIINKDSLKDNKDLTDFFAVIEAAMQDQEVNGDKLKEIAFFMNYAMTSVAPESSQGVIQEDNINQLEMVTCGDSSQSKYLKINFSTKYDLRYDDHLAAIFFPLMKSTSAQQINTPNEDDLKHFSFYIPLDRRAYLYMREIMEIDPLFTNKPWGLDFGELFSHESRSRYKSTVFPNFR